MPKIPEIPKQRLIHSIPRLHNDEVLGPQDSRNGEVKTTKLPHPLKCSKCNYIATSVADSKEHWLDHDWVTKNKSRT